jgi:halimadienyl-diphosphate synthase
LNGHWYIGTHAAPVFNIMFVTDDIMLFISLIIRLNEWNIDDLDMSGFELLVPYFLNALEKLDPPVAFEFPDKSRLLKENRRKMNLIPLEVIFALAAKKHPVTITFSIEAFCDKFDMSRIQNDGFQAINGSYGSSPAATAAVLVHASKWDDKGYEFLLKILKRCPSYAKVHGFVPTLCDVGIFETTWVSHSLSEITLNLFRGKGSKRNKMQLLEKNNVFIKYLKALLKEGGGKLRWVSFDNRIPADVDDTVVAHWIICQFDPNFKYDLNNIIHLFYNGKYFKSFVDDERTFSTSCNVHCLNLLITEYERAKIRGNDPITISIKNKTGISQKVKLEEIIISTAKFIIEQRSKDANWIDKWNKSPSYTTFKAIDLLLSLTRFPELLHSLRDSDSLLRFCKETVEWTLKTQHEDGSWGEPSKNAMGNIEETSYNVRLLKTSCKYWPQDKSIRVSLSNGREYLRRHLDEAMNTPGYFHNSEPYLWIDKQLYTMPRIIKSSMLVALWKN